MKFHKHVAPEMMKTCTLPHIRCIFGVFDGKRQNDKQVAGVD